MTSTTPESRGRIAYTGYLRSIHNRGPIPETVPSFDDLPEAERLAWVNSARVIWEIATAGRSSL